MRHIASMLLLSSLVCSGQGQKPTPSQSELPRSFQADTQHLLDEPCKVVKSTAAMPDSLKQSFAKLVGTKQLELADPGKKFQATDFVVYPSLPNRRLIFAGSCTDRWFVHYELGGYAHSYHVVVFQPGSPGNLQLLWGGHGLNRTRNLDDLRKQIASGAYTAQSEYW